MRTRSSTSGGLIAVLTGLAVVLALVVVPGAPARAQAESDRLAGDSRITTAVAIAGHGFPDGADVVYLARADVFADALAAGALTDGPVLLVPSCGQVPEAVAAEIRRLGPREVVALGGEAAVCTGLLEAAADGLPTRRLAGSSRFDTAVAIAQEAFPDGADEVYLARAVDSPDAVAGGILTAGPILLVPSSGTVPAVVGNEIARLDPDQVVVLGGSVAVADDVASAAAGERPLRRLAGASRVETAVAIGRHEFVTHVSGIPEALPDPVQQVYLARADVFADAVAAGSLVDGPILLTPSCGEVHPALAEEIRRLAPQRVTALGGTAAICDELLAAAAAMSRPPIVFETTEPLSPAEAESLARYDQDGTLTFDDPDGAVADRLEEGDIVVAPPTDAAPSGLLRRVVALEHDGARTTVDSEPAVLTDAVQQGSTFASLPLDHTAVVDEQVLLEGASVGPPEGSRWAQGGARGHDGDGGISITLSSDAVLYDADANPLTTDDQVRASGTTTLRLDAEVDLAIGYTYDPPLDVEAYIEQFGFEVKGRESLDLDVTVEAGVDVFDESVDVWEATLAPITVTIGIVPVVFTPHLSVVVGATGEVSATITAGATQELTLRGGGSYTHTDGWSAVAEYDESFAAKPVELDDVEAEAKAYVRLPASLYIYDVAGPELALEAYVRAFAQLLEDPLWQLFAGILADVSFVVQVPVLSLELARWTFTLWDYELLLAEADPGGDGEPVGSLRRVSAATGGGDPDGSSYEPDLSADGQHVAFVSDADNLVAGDTNGALDVFVHDVDTATTTRVSVATDGTQANGASFQPAVSGDGRYVAFVSDADNLVAHDGNGMSDVFLHDRQVGTTTLVSVPGPRSALAQVAFPPRAAREPAISDDGRFVAYEAGTYDQAMGGPVEVDVYVHEVATGQVVRASVADDGGFANAPALEPSLSADGRVVAFASAATNLVVGDGNGMADIFLRDLDAEATQRVSIGGDGAEGDGYSHSAVVSADGRTVAFASAATNLVAGDGNGVDDIFVRDLTAGTTRRVSVDRDGGDADAFSLQPAISGDGSWVAFASLATDLVDIDDSGEASAPDVFLRDLASSATLPLSLDADGMLGNASHNPSAGGDGSRVVFGSDAALVATDTNGLADIYLWITRE